MTALDMPQLLALAAAIGWASGVRLYLVVLLIGLSDGRVRASVGPTEVDPNAAIAGTPMLAAMLTNADGLWSGSSATDAVRRIHAYRRLPDRDLLVVVGMDEREAMRSADLWQREAPSSPPASRFCC